MKEIIIYGVIALFCLSLGFVTGRQTVNVKESTEYVKGETVKGSVYSPNLVKVETPRNPQLPTVPVVTYIDGKEYEYYKVDTAAIIAEYEKKRYYKELLFDNNYGKLELNLTTQYNSLTGLDYSFTPITTVKTIERKRVWMPFVSASYSSLNYAGFGGGIFYHDIGLNVRYVTDFSRKGIDVGLMYKF